MKNISKREDLLATDNSIQIAPKNYLSIAILIILGTAMFISSFYISSTNSLCYFMIFFGPVLIAIGLAKSVRPSSRLKYCNERLCKHLYYYDYAHDKAIKEAIATGDIDSINANTKANGPLKAIIYATKSKSMFIAQTLTYVPHDYIPDGEPIILCNRS